MVISLLPVSVLQGDNMVLGGYVVRLLPKCYGLSHSPASVKFGHSL